MIDVAYARTMARYNSWQNTNLYGAADGLSDEERRRDRGAFFGSIHATLNHLLWADQAWLARLSVGEPMPDAPFDQSATWIAEWDELKTRRAAIDARLTAWAEALTPEALGGDLTWFSGAAGREMTKPVAQVVAHVFNHQTHHRGQVHAMLTAAGARPGATDLMWLPD